MVISLNEALQDPSVLEELQARPSSFRFRDEVEVAATMERWWPHLRWVEKDLDGNGGDQEGSIMIEGAMANFLQILAISMNFTYRLVPPKDKTFGSLNEDGTWNGMVGLVNRGEVDLGMGPFAITEPRWLAVSYSQPISHTDLRIVMSVGSIEIDPWAFLLPLTPTLWGLLMATLVVVWVATILVGRLSQAWQQWPHSVFLQLYGALMQQGVTMPLSGQRLRMVVGGWVVASALVVWSYGGLLVSVMTIRHVPRPIQTAEDLFEASHVKVIMRGNTAYTQIMEQAKSGVMHDLYGLRALGRLDWVRAGTPEWFHLMSLGDYASIVTTLSGVSLKARDFSSRGRCLLYIAKERLMPFSYSIIAPKNNSILPAINARVRAVVESGLYDYWLQQGIPNGTVCDSSPSTVTVHQPFSLASLWLPLIPQAVFAVFGVGLGCGVLVFLLEVTVCRSASLFAAFPSGCCKRR
ncbi:probable glutamate receptor [Portunus trituberculatus]|uniref:probable glutamate receptor n=1 Tax=Portunus trituberculatus TaxID=210409 RepID=UPI001E1CF64A|nr:probable glutamate receptor [Portunus trituberculatus]